MTFEFRDIIYIVVYTISVAGLLLTYRNRLSNLEIAVTKLTNIIISKNGSLNVIDRASCKSAQDAIYTAIRRGENNLDMTLKKIDTLNENILKIMFHLKISKES